MRVDGEGLRKRTSTFAFQFVADLPQTKRCFRVSIFGFAEYRLERDIVVKVVGRRWTKVIHATASAAAT